MLVRSVRLFSNRYEANEMRDVNKVVFAFVCAVDDSESILEHTLTMVWMKYGLPLTRSKRGKSNAVCADGLYVKSK